jgi:hypothetical protein
VRLPKTVSCHLDIDRAFRPEWKYLLATSINNKNRSLNRSFEWKSPRLSICWVRNRTYQTTVRAKAKFFLYLGLPARMAPILDYCLLFTESRRDDRFVARHFIVGSRDKTHQSQIREADEP